MGRSLNLILSVSLVFMLVFSSCNTSTKEKSNSIDEKSEAHTNITFSIKPAEIVKGFNTWWSYYYREINLAEEFTALDINSKNIDKVEFLTRLQTGKFIPIKTMIRENVTQYKLYGLENRDPRIGDIIKQEANKILAYYQMEGKPLPAFNFKDLNGNIYTPENTKGKIIVLKCWFIHCGTCIEEFPELNKIVQQYKARKDILFISLASDSKQDLEVFLKTKEFDYEVIPDQTIYMVDSLKLWGYPTHIIIDKNGKVRIIAGKYKDFVQTLSKEAEKI